MAPIFEPGVREVAEKFCRFLREAYDINPEVVREEGGLTVAFNDLHNIVLPGSNNPSYRAYRYPEKLKITRLGMDMNSSIDGLVDGEVYEGFRDYVNNREEEITASFLNSLWPT